MSVLDAAPVANPLIGTNGGSLVLCRRDGTRIKEWIWTEMVEREVGAGGCWLWKGHIDHGGYGRFSCSTYGKGGRKSHPAHRISWELANGKKVPKDLLVCHHCDKRSCIRPDHLFVGTHTDNMRDMWSKGRGWNHQPPVMRGENSMLSKVSADMVIGFRRQFMEGISGREIARRAGLSRALVNSAISGKTWAHVPGAITNARELFLHGELFRELRLEISRKCHEGRYTPIEQRQNPKVVK